MCPPVFPANHTESQMQATQDNLADHAARPQLEEASWKRAGISRSYAYELMSAQPPAFPRPVKIGKASRFLSAEVDAWIAARIAARDAAASIAVHRAAA